MDAVSIILHGIAPDTSEHETIQVVFEMQDHFVPVGNEMLKSSE